jgi:hypothetical protein
MAVGAWASEGIPRISAVATAEWVCSAGVDVLCAVFCVLSRSDIVSGEPELLAVCHTDDV